VPGQENSAVNPFRTLPWRNTYRTNPAWTQALVRAATGSTAHGVPKR